MPLHIPDGVEQQGLAGNDPARNPELARRNRRVAIFLGLVALGIYVLFILGYAR
jgi:uncharacterized membrane protein (DUF485 family)